MKKRELYNFKKGLNLTKFEHPRATYAVNKNKRLLKAEIDIMEESVIPDEDYKAYEKEREELAKTYSIKDANGKPKTNKILNANNEIVSTYEIDGVDNPESEYVIHFNKLSKKYKQAIEKQVEKERKYNDEFLEDETDFKPFMIKLELLERESCPQNVMDLIFPMIQE